MLALKLIIISDENVQTDLLLLSAGPPLIPWANRSSAHELEGVISVINLHRMLSYMMCLIFIFFPSSTL